MFSPTQKKWRLFRAWSGRHPVWCSWQVTYRCNFRCRFCHYWADPLGRQAEPDVARYADASRKLAGLGTLMVSLAGGEPFLRADLPEIVAAVGRYHFPFITTNGWFVTPAVADAVMANGCWGVSVSIDYADPARHDDRRGSPGAWAQAWRAVEALSAARRHRWQRVNVLAVLMEDNLDQLEPLAEMAAERGAYFMVQCYGFRKTGSTRFVHDDGPLAERLLAIKQRHPNMLSNPYYLENFDRHLDGGVPGCRAGQAFFNIDSTGDVAICVEEKARPVANLYRDRVSVVQAALTRAARANRCIDCWYNCRGEIECLYRPGPLLRSLPTLLFDQGRPGAGTR